MNELPKWAEDEINSIRDESFRLEDSWVGTGYFLDIDKSSRVVDINFYERLPIGKYIITARVSDSIDMDALKKGIVYTYKIRVFKAPLSERLTKFLKENFNLDMDGAYRFELESLEPLEDVSSTESIVEEEEQ
jgi:hypothetical protein